MSSCDRSLLLRPAPVLALVLAAALACPLPASAVILFGGSGIDAPANNTPPAGFEDVWDRTGFFGQGSNNGTGVYLGNGFVLTARHVAANSLTFTVDGTVYNRVFGTDQTLTNTNDSEADLFLFRIAVPESSGLHDLDPMPILQNSLAGGATEQAILIGTGVGQVESQPVSLPVGGTGFNWDDNASRTKRWANAEIGVSTTSTVLGRTTESFQSVFRFNTGEDGIAALNDSGAPLFYDDNGTIVLAGIVNAVSRADFAKQNDHTLFADLPDYADQIVITPGDLTGDGSVTQDDLDLVLSSFGQSVQAGNWLQGDADGDGQVGIRDLETVLARWGDGPDGIPTASPIVTVPGPAVPEPASALLLTGLLAAVARRPRRA